MVRKAMMGIAIFAALTTLVGCGGPGAAASLKTSTSGDPPGDSSAKGRGPGPGGGGGGGGGGETGLRGAGTGGMGRGAMSVVLGPNDVADVSRGPIEAAMAIQGDLKPIEEIAVRARIEGNIDAVYVREGDRVGRGQVLARFENSNQESARKSAVADLESAKSDVANAQWNADQSQELFKAGAIPERDLRTAQQALIAAQARQAAAEAKLRAVSQELDDTRVLAPTTGVVSVRSVEAGEHVSRGTTVFTVVRNDVLELDAAVPARFAGDVRPSLPVHFNAAGRTLEGKVARVSPTIDPTNRSIAVYLQVPNPRGELKGNTFATGRIVAKTISDALIIPTSALKYQQQAGSKPFVYRIVDQTVEWAVVDLGIVDEVTGIAEVLNGLSEGDRIVVGNIGTLGRGVKVTIARPPEAGRSRPVGGAGTGGQNGRQGRGRNGGRQGGNNPVPRPPQ